MRAVLLAAGRGTRLENYAGGVPKCLIDVGGRPLIVHTVEALLRHGVQEIAVVVGYLADWVIKQLEAYPVSYFHNPFYDRTNSIASLWFAREFLQDEEIVVMNADVYLEEEALPVVLGEQMSPVLFADRRRRMVGDYKLGYAHQRLLKHGKGLSPEESCGEYIGIAKIGPDFLPFFRERLHRLIERQEHDLWWENVLYSFIGEKEIYVRELPEQYFWTEVDVWTDYQRLQFYLQQKGKVQSG